MLTFFLKKDIMKTLSAMQASPSGMAAASQAVPGEFDSRRLLQKSTSFDKEFVDFTYYLFTFHYYLKILVDFWEVISNSE